MSHSEPQPPPPSPVDPMSADPASMAGDPNNPSQTPSEIDVLKSQNLELFHMFKNQQQALKQQGDLLLSLQSLLSGVAIPKKLPNISPPDTYDGTAEKSQSFLNSVNLYIEGRAAEFTTDASKVHFAVSYMKEGKAKTWVDNLLEGEKPLTTIFPGKSLSAPLKRSSVTPCLKKLQKGF